MPKYDVTELLRELEAGTLADNLGAALHECAKSVSLHSTKGKQAKVTLEFTIQQVAESSTQITLAHVLSYKQLTPVGEISEKRQGQSPLFVSAKGISFVPDTQMDWVHTEGEGQ